MRTRPLLLCAAALWSLSCQRAEPAREVIPEPVPSCWEEPDAVLRVRVSEALAERIENGVFPVRSAVSGEAASGTWERLFPDAGPYEPRTRRAGLHRWYRVRVPAGEPATRAETLLEGIEGVETVERAPAAAPAAVYDDPHFSKLWGLDNPSGPDIGCLRVWDEFTTGDPRVVVAVIDGGIDLAHPDLAANCLASGHYNYVDDNGTLVPHVHGTHVAGTIAAVGNNGIGTAGVAGGNAALGRRGVSLLSCQIFKTVEKDGKTYDETGAIERAIKEAADKGAVICQNSWGYVADADRDGTVTDKELDDQRRFFEQTPLAIREAIDYFVAYAGCDNEGNQLPDSPMKGGLVIFAAGNEGLPYGPPANYAPVVAVGAIDSDGSRPDFSNYGDWVDLCGPGVGITSTVPDGKYGKLRGTSMACPHVTGTAALLVSYFGGPGFTCDDLRKRLLGGADPRIPARQVGPLVNAYGSFTYDKNEPPQAVGDAPRIRLEAPGAASTLDLNGVFTDPNGDVLSFSVRNGSADVLHTQLKDGLLTVTGIAYGAGTVELTATDPFGAACSLSLPVLVRKAGEEIDLAPADGVTRLLTVRTGWDVLPSRIRILGGTGACLYDGTDEVGAFQPKVIDLGGLAPGRYQLLVDWEGVSCRKSFVKR